MRKKLIAIFVAIFLLTGSVGIIALADNEIDILNDTYVKGQTLTIPNNVQVGVTNYTIKDPVILSPEGKEYVTNELVLRQMGIYTVRYTAVNGSSEKSCEEQFTALSNLYTIEGKGTYEWKANEKTPDTYGVNVDLAQGDKFVYNKIIDLNDLAPTDDLVNLYVVPKTIGRPDFQVLTITLTDIYDSTNMVMISGTNVRDGYTESTGHWEYEYSKYTCYIKGGSTNQPLSGWQGSSLHVNNTYGYSALCSFCGLGPGGTSMDTDRFTVSFDYQERQVLKDGRYVIDLDNPNDFTEMWNGFTTGEVILSISLSDAGSFVITDIANEKLTSDLVFLDNVKPVVTVDYEGYEEVPNTMLGLPYPLFEATAQDSYAGALEVSRKVYFDYAGAKEEIAIVNGAFTPLKVGTYTVENSAVDYCGNVGVECYEIVVAPTSSPIIASIVSSTKITSGKMGDKITVADINIAGGYGNLEVERAVYDQNGNEIKITNGYFVPFTAGAYTVEYKVSDYVGQTKTLKYTVAVEESDLPVFLEEVNLPRYVMNGKQYELPLLSGYAFSTGVAVEKQSEIWVKDGKGSRKLDSNIYLAVVTSNGMDIEITYKLQDGGKECSQTYVVKGYITTKENGAMVMKSYFVSSANVTASEESDKLTYTTSSSGETISFINPVLAEGFLLDLSLVGMSNANVITLTLTDYENSNLKVSAKIQKNGSASVLTINGTKTYDLPNVAFGGLGKYTLRFNNIYSQLGVTSNESTAWFSIDSSNNYFASGKVYLDIEFTQVSGESSLQLFELNGQNLKQLAVDLLRPSVALFGSTVALKYELGQNVTTIKAIGADVLDPYVKTTLTVTDANKNVVTDVNGVKLQGVSASEEWTFNLASYGNYTILYTATDSNNKMGSYQYVVGATDDIKPTLHLEYRVVENAKVGDIIYVPSARGEDNVTKNVKVGYYIITPDGVLHYFNRELYDSFKVSVQGEYVIRYTLIDDAGNMTLKDFTIVVE